MLEGVESIVSAGGDVGGSHAAVSTEGGGGAKEFCEVSLFAGSFEQHVP